MGNILSVCHSFPLDSSSKSCLRAPGGGSEPRKRALPRCWEPQPAPPPASPARQPLQPSPSRQATASATSRLPTQRPRNRIPCIKRHRQNEGGREEERPPPQTNPARGKPGGQGLWVGEVPARGGHVCQWPAGSTGTSLRPLAQGPTARPDQRALCSLCFAFPQGECCKDTSGT